MEQIKKHHKGQTISSYFWTDDKFEFIKLNEDLGIARVTELFNEKYNCDVTRAKIKGAIYDHGKNIHFPAPHKRYKYNDDMINWLKENVEGKSNKELASMFNERFNMNVKPSNINDLKRDHGIRNHSGYIHHPNTGSFKPKSVPNNKYSVGTLFLDSTSNMLMIKVSDFEQPSVYNCDQVAKLMYQLWHNVTLESDECIVFLDGNKYNFAKDNLLKAKHKDVSYAVCTIRYNDLDNDFKPTLVLQNALNRAIKEKGENEE